MSNASALVQEPLTDEEWESIYGAMPSERARLLLMVIRFTGFRVSTALALGRRDLFRKPDGYWLSTTTKRGRRIENAIPTELAESLLHLNGPWFPWSRQAFSMMLRRRSEEAIGRPIGPHLLRKRAVTKHWQATHDLAATAKFAGHSNPALTASRYILPDIAQRRKVVDAL
jgi:integrase